MSYIVDSHHITMSVNGAREDVDFHVKVLGLRLIKRTVLFDGTIPIYHLYYSNADGDPGAVLTTFPFGQAGIYGRRGTNQAREVLLAVPAGSLNYWSSRLHERAADSGTRPCSIAAVCCSGIRAALSTSWSRLTTTLVAVAAATGYQRSTPSTAFTASVYT
ncbi:hypothetical protein [Mycobacterium sp. URHB0021]|jgi:catechol 2,3-dioxygenase-like lactoylglutathione lyase family enzyme